MVGRAAMYSPKSQAWLVHPAVLAAGENEWTLGPLGAKGSGAVGTLGRGQIGDSV